MSAEALNSRLGGLAYHAIYGVNLSPPTKRTMTMALTYSAIITKIEKLKKQADKLASQRERAIVRAKAIIAENNITAEELGLDQATRTSTRGRKRRGKKKAGRATSPTARTGRTARGRAASLYYGPDNQTWSGRGRMPRWMSDALSKGKKKEDFLR